MTEPTDQPYSAEAQRAATYIADLTGIGGGDDPVGFLIASHAALRSDKDAAYLERNQVVALLTSLYPSGIAHTDIPGWLPEWHGCVYIDLPTGQASWHYHDSQAYLFAHLPAYAGAWDGHTTDEKYARLAALAVAEREALA